MFGPVPKRHWLAVGLLAVGLTGCASHVKGSWACALEPGVVCGSISDIDHKPASPRGAASAAAGPTIEGVVPAKLLGQGGWTAGVLAGAPVREPDPILKIAFAPWIDTVGDYHAAAEVYAVMRHGSWYIAPASSPHRVDISRLPISAGPVIAPAAAATNASAPGPARERP